MSQRVGGRYEMRGPQRESRVGTWHLLSDPDGHARGGLLLNRLDGAERERLESVVQLDIPGLLAVIDQVSDATGHWLITASPAAPTVAQVLGARIQLPEPLAVLVAMDTGETLAALHQAQRAHGAFGADTTVLSGEGRALLAECGYAHALEGGATGPGHDVMAWVRLVRDLASSRAQDRARQLLTGAADAAEALGGSAGLTAALSGLAEQAKHINGYGERSALAMLAALIPPSPIPTPRVEDAATVLAPIPNEALTVPATGAAKTALLPDVPNQETLQPAQLEARMQQRKDEVLRFGRGVAPLPDVRVQTAPMWTGAAPYGRPKPPSRWRARLIAILTTLTTLVLLAVVAWWIIQRMAPLKVGEVTIALETPIENTCDVEARILGTIKTNGATGTITYRWLTSDGKTTPILTEYVNLGEEQVVVPLEWEFGGRGTIDAKATLEIITPEPIQTSTEFTYSCQ